jgi:hypothetical protein
VETEGKGGPEVRGGAESGAVPAGPRALVAAKLANMKREDTLKQNHRSPNREFGPPPVSVGQAAESLKVGKSNVYKAKQVQATGVPALVPE